MSIVSSSAPLAGSTTWTLDTVPTVRIGVVEGEGPYQLFRARSALTLEDGRIVVSNAGTHEIRVFGPEGVFLYAFGRQGQGPGEFGEFSSMRVFRVGDDSLAITDGANGRLNLYDTRGAFGRTITLAPSERFGRPSVFGYFGGETWFAVAAVGSGVLRGAPGERIDMDHAYLAFPSAGEPTLLATVDDRTRVVNELAGVTHYPYVPLTPDPSASVDGQSVLVAEGALAEVRRFDLTGVLTDVYRWDLPARPVDAIWDRYQEAYLEEVGDEDRRRRYARFLERDLPIPETLPAVSAVESDALGNVWVARYRLPWETDATWDVLSAEGRWLATITVPGTYDILEIGKSGILVRQVDELGIERIARYPLHRDGRGDPVADRG